MNTYSAFFTPRRLTNTIKGGLQFRSINDFIYLYHDFTMAASVHMEVSWRGVPPSPRRVNDSTASTIPERNTWTYPFCLVVFGFVRVRRPSTLMRKPCAISRAIVGKLLYWKSVLPNGSSSRASKAENGITCRTSELILSSGTGTISALIFAILSNLKSLIRSASCWGRANNVLSSSTFGSYLPADDLV